MSELSPKAKAVLDDARPFEEPPAGQQAIVREGLQARLASGAQGPASSAAPGSGSSGLALQAAVFVGAVAIGAGGLLFLGRTTNNPPLQSAPSTTATLAPGPALPPVVAVQDQEFDLPPAPPPAPEAVPEVAPAVAPAQPAALPAPSSPPPEPSASAQESAGAEPEKAEPAPAEDPCALAGELAALQAARVKLEANEPAHALRLVNERSKQCPNAALGEERRLVKVMCLCGLGRTDLARDEAAWLRRDYPDSALLSRLDSTCARAE